MGLIQEQQELFGNSIREFGDVLDGKKSYYSIDGKPISAKGISARLAQNGDFYASALGFWNGLALFRRYLKDSREAGITVEEIASRSYHHEMNESSLVVELRNFSIEQRKLNKTRTGDAMWNYKQGLSAGLEYSLSILVE